MRALYLVPTLCVGMRAPVFNALVNRCRAVHIRTARYANRPGRGTRSAQRTLRWIPCAIRVFAALDERAPRALPESVGAPLSARVQLEETTPPDKPTQGSRIPRVPRSEPVPAAQRGATHHAVSLGLPVGCAALTHPVKSDRPVCVHRSVGSTRRRGWTAACRRRRRRRLSARSARRRAPGALPGGNGCASGRRPLCVRFGFPGVPRSSSWWAGEP